MTERVDPNAQPATAGQNPPGPSEVIVRSDAAAREVASTDGLPDLRFPERPDFRHPNLGLPPIDMTAGFPEAAERIRLAQARFAARALEAAIAFDPSLTERYDELGLRRLLHDAEVLIERLTRSIASGDPRWMREIAEWTAPVYRRRAVPLEDMMLLCDGIRDAVAAALAPDEQPALDEAIAAAIAVFEWNARLAGDARKRNPLLRFLYRGA